MAKNTKKHIVSRAVMVEKEPFFVITMTPTYNGMNLDFANKLLVRPCVSEDDLSTARFEYEELKRRYGEKESNISFNPMEYYLVLGGDSVYVGNIINRSVCRRVRKE